MPTLQKQTAYRVALKIVDSMLMKDPALWITVLT